MTQSTEQKTTPDQREALRAAGFIRVNGLKYRVCGEQDSFNTHPIPTPEEDCHRGRYDSNNGKVVIVTVHGEVWLAATPLDSEPNGEEIYARQQALTRELCPNGHGAGVPMSNSETIVDIHDWLRRLGDPDLPARE